MLTRDEYRKIKGFSKDQMDKWLGYEKNIMYNSLRKEFNAAYKDELDSSIQNFLIAIAYTLHYNEDIHLAKDELASFMDDLFVSVDMFRKGEYKPDEYEQQLKDDGVVFEKYDYDKLYREQREKYDKQVKWYQDKLDKARDFLLVGDNALKYSLTQNEIKELKDILEGVD